MSFQPMIPLSGIAGWRMLERTQETQQTAFNSSAEIKRDVAYFKENIANVASSADLIEDRRLLKVALTAFGLEDSINHKALLRKVLDEGTESRDAFANRLNNNAQREFANAFGFGNASGSQTGNAAAMDAVVTAFQEKSFQTALGQTNPEMEAVLEIQRELPKLAAEGDGAWYNVLASKTLRKAFETALGLPKEFAAIDIDAQLRTLKAKSKAIFKSDDLSIFKEQKNLDKFTQRYLAMSQLTGQSGVQTGASAALTILRGIGSNGSNGLMNLLFS